MQGMTKKQKAAQNEKDRKKKAFDVRKAKEAAYWDPHLEANPTYDYDRRPRSFTVDYEKAIQNLTDILIDSAKFNEMNTNIFLAMDEDNVGILQTDVAEEFVRSFLRGNQIEGMPNTDFEEANEEIYNILKEQESGEVDASEMAKFMRELIKHQIKCLQQSIEKGKFERAMARNPVDEQ